ncbi:envelope protein [Psittacid alphaherpesvirus 5]|uniref:Envelope protein n=1 Tax=Psittacid alphaherpesvirus 5 TaxID=2972693 RepID=A0A5P9JP10_9ALPH|nr:envelope protein [Psittacid alphaherpesvirus 5]QFU14582.1 envelope protein [Psittacid alphaherpesvirus 5]UOO01053.1 envelope protein [Psittacid alphaherpesvirus 5]
MAISKTMDKYVEEACETSKFIINPIVSDMNPEDSQMNALIFSDLLTESEFVDDDTIIKSRDESILKKYRPLQTPELWIAPVLAVVSRVLCVIAFYIYGACFGTWRMFRVVMITTVIHALHGIYVCFCMYWNIRADLMPMLWSQRLVTVVLHITLSVYFIIMVYMDVLGSTSYGVRELDSNKEHEKVFIDTPVTSWLCSGIRVSLPIFSAIYTSILLCDALSTILPRVWAAIILGRLLCF